MEAFNIEDALLDVIGYEGLPYPGLWLPGIKGDGETGREFEYMQEENRLKTHSALRSVLRKRDAQGRYYFLPVILQHKGKEYEIPNAFISFTGRKAIVETPMVGRRGSVKEPISLDDHEIGIQGVTVAGDFPEEVPSEISELYNINEAVTPKCALTDIFLEEDDRVVIRSIKLSDMRGTGTCQTVKMELVMDRNSELIIE